MYADKLFVARMSEEPDLRLVRPLYALHCRVNRGRLIPQHEPHYASALHVQKGCEPRAAERQHSLGVDHRHSVE
ncbi:hypothetical protein D3C80_1659080 [compost metagenome]